MKHGDLSNQAGHTIAFRCEDFLLHYKEDGFTDKVLNAILGKVNRVRVDELVRDYMEFLYRQTEYNVDLILEEDSNTDKLKEFLDSLPFNRLVLISRPSQISQRLLVGDLSYYVDDNEYRRSLVNNPHAVTLKQIAEIVKTRRVR